MYFWYFCISSKSCCAPHTHKQYNTLMYKPLSMQSYIICENIYFYLTFILFQPYAKHVGNLAFRCAAFYVLFLLNRACWFSADISAKTAPKTMNSVPFFSARLDIYKELSKRRICRVSAKIFCHGFPSCPGWARGLLSAQRDFLFREKVSAFFFNLLYGSFSIFCHPNRLQWQVAHMARLVFVINLVFCFIYTTDHRS